MRLLLALFLCLATPLGAAPRNYVLEAERSSVSFFYDFGENVIRGRMPVASADLRLDFNKASDSSARVTLDLAGASGGFPFATQAMLGPKVLDARSHPEITFVSTAVRAAGEVAEIDGLITIRGVTRPITLIAALSRPVSAAQDDFSHVSVRLTGAVSRAAFGATGWSDMVGDEIRLDILARIAEIN